MPSGADRGGYRHAGERPGARNFPRHRHVVCELRREGREGAPGVPGVEEASVNLATGRASVRYLAGATGLPQMGRAVEGVG
jgi:hypothetical protein